MKRWRVLPAALALLAVVGFGTRPMAATMAQPGETDGLAATVEALQTQVANIEERVAALERNVADGDEDRTGTGEPADAAAAPTDEPTEAAIEEDSPIGSRDNPIPLDASAEVGDYTVRVVEVIPNANDLVFAENEFNEPPAEGRQFLIVTVEVTYRGDAVGMPAVDLNPQLVGDRSTIYTTFNDNCGVVPNDAFLIGELGPGGLVRYNLCWSVVSGEVDSLILFIEPFFAFDANPVYFAIRATV